MKTAMAAIATATMASACCLGPVALSGMGAAGLVAASVRLEAYRPWFVAATGLLLAAGFYSAYRPGARAGCEDGSCRPAATRAAQIVLWMAAIAAALLVAFPYYVGYFV